MLKHVSGMISTQSIYWVFMCSSCRYPLIVRDLVVDSFGDSSCKNCGTFVADVHYWNPDEKNTHMMKSLCVFPDNQDFYTICTECGQSPYDEDDDVTVDNFGNYVCYCGGELDIAEYETDINY